MSTLMERAIQLEEEGIFLGGSLDLFETAGRKSLVALIQQGMLPGSKVLDVGSGCLRCGYWLIHFLDRGCYFGIEPNIQMHEAGIRVLLEPDLTTLKEPCFDHNDRFDFSVFQCKFDFVVGRSIWTHASKAQIETMLDSFLEVKTEHGVFLTSYIRPTLFNRDYQGSQWIGRSHQSQVSGIICHRLGWIKAACAKRGLRAVEIKGNPYNFGNQRWLRIASL